jgi:hypothetical protein
MDWGRKEEGVRAGMGEETAKKKRDVPLVYE